MDSQLPKFYLGVIAFLIYILVYHSFPCLASEVDMDLFGLTYHLREAPLKLDKNGSRVFNPGVGLGYDFREDIHTPGLSPEIHGGMFENCNNHPFSFLGAGGRYRKFFHKNWFWETNLLMTATYGNDSDNKRYKLNATPYVNFGVGRDYGKYLVTYFLSYIPKGSDGGITSSTDMLFLSAAISF